MGALTTVRNFLTIGNGSRTLGTSKVDSSILPSQQNVWRWHNNSREVNYAEHINGEVFETSIVAAVLGWIIRNFPSAPVAVSKRDSKGKQVDILDHKMVDLVETPNEHYSGIALWTATLIDWWTDSNAYWLKLRNNIGEVVQLWWVPAWMIEPMGARNATSETFIQYYRYRPSPGVTVQLMPEDVVHFRNGIDPTNPRKGLGRFKSLLREIYTDQEAGLFTSTLLSNMGVPGLVISPRPATGEDSNEITPQDAAATKLYFQDATTGARRGEPIVMRSPVDVEQFGFSPDAMNMRDVRTIPEERISGVLGVAAIVAGLGAGLQRSTFANFAEAREASYEENIIPTQRYIAADLRVQLLRDFEPDISSFRVRFDTKDVAVLQEDKDAESIRLTAQWTSGITMLSEVRAKLGYDTSPDQDIYMIPLTSELVRAEDVASILASPNEPTALDVIGANPPTRVAQFGVDPTRAEVEQPLAPIAGPKFRSVPFLKLSHASGAALIHAIGKSGKRIESRMAGRIRVQYEQIGEGYAAAFETFVSSGKSKASPPANVDKMTPSDIARLIQNGGTDELTIAQADILAKRLAESIVASHSVAGTAKLAIKSLYQDTYQLTGQATFDVVSKFLNVDLLWGLDDPYAQAIVEQGGKRAAMLGIEQFAGDSLTHAISEGIKANKGAKAIAQDIKARVGGTSKAETIARTEVKYAQNVSSLSAYRKSGVVTSLLAWDNQSGNDDGPCVARDGSIFSFDDADAETMDEHPRGTLSWSPIVGQVDD